MQDAAISKQQQSRFAGDSIRFNKTSIKLSNFRQTEYSTIIGNIEYLKVRQPKVALGEYFSQTTQMVPNEGEN